MTKGQSYIKIHGILSELHPSESIALIEKIGKELRRKNSIRISAGGMKNVIDADRPDLLNLKENERKD
jgi:hypothetical protein